MLQLNRIQQLQANVILVNAEHELAKIYGKSVRVSLKNYTVFTANTEVEIKNSFEPIHVLERVSKAFKISLIEMCGKSRKHDIVTARHTAMYLLREMFPKMSLVQIGKIFGNRNYSSVIHACENIDGKMKIYRAYRQQVQWIKEDLLAQKIIQETKF